MKSKLILLVAAAAASAQAPSALEFFKGQITANGLKADVSFLASDALEGRGTPSRGLDLAGEYIASEFRRGGLEPAGDDGYFQTANFVSIETSTEGLAFSLETGGKTLTADKASTTILNAAAADLNRMPAVIVPAGDATALSAIKADDVHGKALILLLGGGGPGGMGRGGIPPAAVQLGAAAVVTVRGAAAAGGRGGRGGGGGGRAQLREASAVSQTPGIAVSDAAIAEALAAKPTDAMISLHVAAPKTTAVKLRNVAGLVRGSDPALRDTYIVVTGHYDHLGIRDNGQPGDHIFNGANDDASGTSSVIEIGKAMAALPQRPKRSILFMALFGEELGDLGSGYYGAHPIFPLAKTVADVNLEHMGRTDDSEGPRIGAFNMTGFDYTNIHDIMAKAGKQTDIQVVKHEKNSDSFYLRSDNAAFAEVGVPATTISVSYIFPDYHAVGDEWPKLDYENMAKIDRTVALGVLDMANNEVAPQWDAANPKVAAYVKAREATMKGK